MKIMIISGIRTAGLTATITITFAIVEHLLLSNNNTNLSLN